MEENLDKVVGVGVGYNIEEAKEVQECPGSTRLGVDSGGRIPGDSHQLLNP
jgi:hypothetical protein